MGYLHTIGLENFRLFKDRTVFELAPITILTGVNSSGKSSFIKSLQLLKQSVKETGNISELNFSGGRHNLGWYGQALNSESNKKEMVFTFNFPFEAFPKKTLIDLTFDSKSEIDLSGHLKKVKVYLESGEVIYEIEEVKNGKNDGSEISEDEPSSKKKSGNSYRVKSDLAAYISLIHSVFGKFWLRSDLKEKYGEDVKANATLEFQEYLKNNHHLFEFSNANIFKDFYFRYFDNSDFKKIIENTENWELIKPIDLIYENYSSEDLGEIIKSIKKLKNEGLVFSINNPEYIFEDYFSEGIYRILSLLNIEFPMTLFFDGLKEEEFEIKKQAWRKTEFGNYIFKEVFEKGIKKGLNELKKFFLEIESLSSFRANTERIYSPNSEIVEINKLVWEFSQFDPEKWKTIKEFLGSSLRIFGIGDDIKIRSHQGVVSEIFVIKKGKEILLADLGYGYSQLIPIILKVGLIAMNKMKNDFYSSRLMPTLFLLEEPESNLHPSLQSKLAEFLYQSALKWNIQFIIETHSEYMIRNFQYLTAKKDLNPWDLHIYYFNHPDSDDFKTSPFRKIEIMSDGRLSEEFGEGFFDEIPRLLAFLYNSSSN